MIIKGKALQLVRCERFKVIKAPRTCTIHEERGKTENLVYTSFQILVWGSPSVRICAQIWRSLLNLQQGTNVFQCADFWAGDFLMFEFCIFGFWEFEDFGREKWGWRRGRLWAKKGGGCRLLGGKSWTAQFFTLLAGFNVHYPARHLGNDKYHPILSW